MTMLVLGLWALALIGVAVLWPERLLGAAIISSVFEGVALVNAGGVGISPYYFTLMLIAARCITLRVDAGQFFGRTRRNRSVLMGVGLLLVIAVGGALVLPTVFAGTPVMSPRLSVDSTAPLEFSTSNLAQSIYLILNVAFLWYVAQQRNDTATIDRAGRAVMLAGAIVVAIGVYQLISALTGLPFPDDILYSNDGYVMQHGTAILDMPRICSTFTEPAGLAVFLIGLIAFLTSPAAAAFGSLRWRMVLLLASITIALLSTSSTAYLGLAGIAVWRIITHIFMPAIQTGGSMKRVVITVILLGTAGAVAARNDTIRELIDKTVFQKDESDSYQERHDVDSHSLQLGISTLGLGVGLGSNRASSFFPSAISTIGIYGIGLLVVIWVQLLRSPAAEAGSAGTPALAALLIGVVATKFISSPDLATPALWAAMALLVAAHGQPNDEPEEQVDVISMQRTTTTTMQAV